ncbi:hypothetical protein OF377_01525 [Ureaplasma sp. ES3154-GEN]|uniref:Vmc-like lipoprotein signal peptide domain-containing protein n=1 Tax=Ureaplasma sp. ES3154-GEN TaxID=2984844 RepID=UPI0021E7580E|nr:hypothetical protein [Ureaplasma sp. ES3154-GEN]MCV3743566.1 hypothetical protein [Ureaplasma sp. ES3154-GEN]
MKKLNKKILLSTLGAVVVLGSVAAIAASCKKDADKKTPGKDKPGSGSSANNGTNGATTGATNTENAPLAAKPMKWSNAKNATAIDGSNLFIVPQPPLGQHIHPDGSVHGHVHSTLLFERQAHDLVVTQKPVETINLADPVPMIKMVRINFVSNEEATKTENKFDAEGNAGLYEKDGKVFNAKGEVIDISVNAPTFYYENMNNVRLLTNIPGLETNIVTFTKEDVDRGYLIANFAFTHGLPAVKENLFEKEINYFYVNRLQFLHYHNDQIGDHWEVNLSNLPRVSVKYEVHGQEQDEMSQLDSNMIDYRGVLDAAREAMTLIHPDRRFKFVGLYGHTLLTLNTNPSVKTWDSELAKDENGQLMKIGEYTFWKGRFPDRGQVTWAEKVTNTAPTDSQKDYELYRNPYGESAASGGDVSKGNLFLWNEFVKTAVELDHKLNVEAVMNKTDALDKEMSKLAQKLSVLTEFINKYRELDVVGDEVYGYVDEWIASHKDTFKAIPGKPDAEPNIFQTAEPNDAEKMFNAVLNSVLTLNTKLKEANIDYTNKEAALAKGNQLIEEAVTKLSQRLTEFKEASAYVDNNEPDVVTPTSTTVSK